MTIAARGTVAAAAIDSDDDDDDDDVDGVPSPIAIYHTVTAKPVTLIRKMRNAKLQV